MSQEISCFDITCQQIFVSIEGLRDHFFLQHSGVTVFKCRLGSTCSRTFDRWDSYNKHLSRKHDFPKHCDVCALPKFCALQSENNKLSGIPPLSPSFTDESEQMELQFIESSEDIDFHTLLSQQADILVAKVYNRPGLPRCLVDCMIEDVTTFLSSGFLGKIKSKVLNALQRDNIEESEVAEITEMFDNLSSPFSHLATEFLRQKHFQTCGVFIPPETYDIETRLERRSLHESVELKMENVTGQFIPLRYVLKNFFQLPDVLSSTLEYMKYLESEEVSVSNITQCAKWKMIKEKLYKPEDIVIPLTVYYDDWEPNNALGPHCQKIGSVYIDLPCLPPECQSKVDNIFEALLFNADDRKNYENRKTFRPLIEELKLLESQGIFIETDHGLVKIYFATVLLKGDNLGLNGMCGFVECFAANFPCRICKASKQLTETLCREDPTLLRNVDNYKEDLNTNNPSLTGIKEELVFNEIKSLYCDGIASVFGTDEMHDIAEGMAHYTMIPALNHFHKIDSLFLETLNVRMYMFDYGKVDSRNQPPSITLEQLQKSKLKMTAAEMICFVNYFGLFVGDLISEDDQFWHLYLLLHDIMAIVRAKTLPKDIVNIFQYLVEEHHILYMQLTKEKLKPKHHFLLHYGRVIQFFGPLANISCMRDEARHKVLKAYTNTCMSRRNILKSLASKRMFALCLRFLVKESILPKIIVGPGTIQDFSESKYFSSFSNNLPPLIKKDPECFCANWIDYKGTRYVVGMILITGIDKSRCLRFGEILFIVPDKDYVFFICSPLLNLGFNAHVRGFEIEKPDKMLCLKMFWMRSDSLFDPFPLSIHSMANGEKYIVLKYVL